jgi:hypothetical protein
MKSIKTMKPTEREIRKSMRELIRFRGEILQRSEVLSRVTELDLDVLRVDEYVYAPDTVPKSGIPATIRGFAKAVSEAERRCKQAAAALAPFEKRLKKAREHFRECLARHWIALNGVTRGVVQDPPSHIFTAEQFHVWLFATQNTKPFVSWRGTILPREVLDSGLIKWAEYPGKTQYLDR